MKVVSCNTWYCGFRLAAIVSLLSLSTAAGPVPVPPKAADPMLLHSADDLTVRSHLQFGINAVSESNLFWDLAALATGDTDFDADAQWLEFYLEPGLSFERRLSSSSELFGKASGVASLTAGTDAFDTGDTGRMTLEEGFLERFDPLHYDGSPSTWATGSKSAIIFINSNVQSHGLSLQLTPTLRDIVTLRYAHVRAHELRSPVQFGQATRVDFSDGLSIVISGVTDAHLSDDFFLEYTRTINSNTFLTAGVSIANPGDGIKNAAGGDASSWTGAFINVVINF